MSMSGSITRDVMQGPPPPPVEGGWGGDGGGVLLKGVGLDVLWPELLAMAALAAALLALSILRFRKTLE